VRFPFAGQRSSEILFDPLRKIRDAAQRLARLVLDLDPGAAHPTDLAGHAA